MHEKCFKIDFFVIFRNLQKKLPIFKKRYAEILHTGGTVVTDVEKKVKSVLREKLKFGIFETPKWHIFNHIGSAQRRFSLYFAYDLPIMKYA